MKKLAYNCKICGRPGVVEFEPTGDPQIDEFILNFAGMLACNSCKPELNRETKSEQLRLPVNARVPYADP